MNIAELNKEINKLDRKFKTASDAGKRVIIAQDAINQVNARRFVVESGVWIKNEELEDRMTNIPYDERERNETLKVGMKDLLRSGKIGPCNVCALGGLMASCTIYNNKSTLKDFNEEWGELGEYLEQNEKLSNRLNKIFTKRQLMMVEVAFEGGTGYFEEDSCSLPNSIIENCKKFFNLYANNDRKRFIAIMQNIIDNNGTFVPNTQ